MRRYFNIALPLQFKILIGVILAVTLPLGTLGLLSYQGVRQVSVRNIEAFIAESGARRQQAIENDFKNAFNAVNSFLNDDENVATLVAPLEILRDQGTSSESLTAENRAENAITSNLISTGYFYSAWVVSETGFTQVSANVVSNDPRILANARTLQNEANATRIQRAGRQLRERGESLQAILEFDLSDESNPDNLHLVLLNPLFASDNNTQVIGYLALDLNLETIITSNLGEEFGQLRTYAFVILADGETIIAEETTKNSNLININTIGAQLSLDDTLAGVETYPVVIGENTREVIGYHTNFTINNDLELALVAEIDTAVIGQQLNTTFSEIGFPIIVGTIVLVVLLMLFTYQLINPALGRLRLAMQNLMRSNFEFPVPDTRRSDEIGALANTFTDMREQIFELTEDMNRRLQARIRDVRITQDIGRTVTAERDLDRIMNQVVNLIVENFPSIYHAQIFLLDSAREFAILRASTGRAGEDLLQRGHKLAVGSVSVIGQVTEQGQLLIARDTAESDVHRRNEFLQETRAELAIPLNLGGNIIGALDVQSIYRDSFDDDQVTALQTLADQITIAIENARLYEESARLLADLERDRRATTRYAWQQYMYAARTQGMETKAGYDTGHNFSDIEHQAYITGEPAIGEPTDRNTIPFVVPINLRGETIGVVEYEVPEGDFTRDKVLLAQELVSRLAIGLDNARLFQDRQQSADRERIVNEISASLTTQTDIESIIQTAIQEVGEALRTPQVAIRLQRDLISQGNGNGTNGHSSNNENPSQPESSNEA